MSLAVTPLRPWRKAPLIGFAVALTVTVGACSGKSDGSSRNSGADKRELVSTAGTAAGKVDQVTWNLTSGEPDTLDPPNAATYGGGQVVMNLCDTLVRYDADYNMSPGLADYKQVSPTELVYTLRGNARFWDGNPVTAQDVAFSLERAKKSSIVSSFFASVKSVKATGAKEVTVEFSVPDEKFNTEMTNIAGVVVEKAYTEKAGKDFGTAAGGLMCSGPFKLDRWKSGDSITMTRNDSYWDATRKPLAKHVKFTFVTDTTALTKALDAGEMDGAYELPPTAIQALEKSKTGNLYFGPSTQSDALSIANTGVLTEDPKLGAALQRVIDRAALAEAVYRGAGQPLYTFVTPRTWPTDQTTAYETAYKQFEKSRSYDLKAAKQLVEESGYNGQDLVLAYGAGDPTASRIVQLVQQQAKQAGINLKLQSMGALAFQQAGYDASKRKGIDLMFGSSFNSVSDPLEPAQFAYLPGSPYNYVNYHDAATAKLLDEAASTFDSAKRAEIVIKAQQRWEAANLTIPLVATDTVTFLNKRLAGAVTSFAYWSMPNMAFIGSAA
ncbi:ABC transporter substrate-binding protein [Streptomyces sp. NPDC048277]|uniref:ABC transporter substrate-binding protein n=1 Tax=Streptomyces sp. NPDC048277 TaxID=3155027 RepID=UPI003411E8EC